MKGLHKYSHKDREQVVKEMVPLIKKKFGANLIAIAVQASYARNEDFDYSDLELIAFVKKMPRGKEWEGMGKVRNGMLVELLWSKKEMYLKHVKEVTEDWYIAGSDKLLPVFNKQFIETINKYKVKNLKEKCLKRAAHQWYEVQESTAKVLNAITQKNKEGLPLVLFDMYLWMLKTLSYLNQKPYLTFAKFITQSKKFKTRPEHFEDLTKIIIDGEYQNLAKLQKIVKQLFTEFEDIFDELGFDLYYDNVDPNKPMNKWV